MFFAYFVLLDCTVISCLPNPKSNTAVTGSFVFRSRNQISVNSRQYVVENSALVDLACFEPVLHVLRAFGRVVLPQNVLDHLVGVLGTHQPFFGHLVSVIVEHDFSRVDHLLFRHAQSVVDSALAHSRIVGSELLGKIGVLELPSAFVGPLDFLVCKFHVRNEIPIVVGHQIVGLFFVELRVELVEKFDSAKLECEHGFHVLVVVGSGFLLLYLFVENKAHPSLRFHRLDLSVVVGS